MFNFVARIHSELQLINNSAQKKLEPEGVARV